MPQILLTTFFTSINFRLKNTKKYSILLNWHFLKFSILWNIYRCDIEFLACNVYIGNTIYYTYKVWTCIVYDWKHLEAITNQDGGGGESNGAMKTQDTEDTSWGFRRENCQQSSDCITVPRGKVHRPLENLQASSNRSCSSASHLLHTKCFLPVPPFPFHLSCLCLEATKAERRSSKSKSSCNVTVKAPDGIEPLQATW